MLGCEIIFKLCHLCYNNKVITLAFVRICFAYTVCTQDGITLSGEVFYLKGHGVSNKVYSTLPSIGRFLTNWCYI